MAKKKKQETGKTIWHIREDGSVVPIIQNQQEEIAPVKDTWLKKGALDDSGYAIQNPLDAINRFNASILMTGVDALGQFGKGFLSSAEGVSDIAKTTTADVLDFFGADNKARQLRKSAEDQWGINKELDESLIDDNGFGIDDMSFLGTKGKGVGQGLGTTAFSLTTGSLGGSAVSMGLLGLSAAGNAEQEAIKEMKANQKINGLSDKEIYQQAKLYGLISGTVEAGTEMMFGGLAQGSKLLGIGTGAFDSADDAVINALTKKISNKLVKTFTQAGLKATSEGVEEVLSGLGNAWAKKLTYMKDEDIKKLIEDENLLDSFLSGTFSAVLSQSPSVARNITTTENGKLRLQTNEEIRDFITNLNQQEQQVVEREVENRLGQEEKVTKKRRAEIEKQVIEDLDRGYINAQTIRDTLGENYNAERDVRLNESFNEETRRTQAYENDLSKYDEKQRKTIQTAIDSGLLNNSNKTHDFVDLIAKISADKGIDFDFTNNERIKDTGFAIDGKQVNGFIQDGKIMLNLESNQALNKTVGHEITHVLEGTDLYNSLQDSLKSFIGEREWNNRISELEKTYKNVKGANIENELTSDLVGEYVFNDESFVRSLSTRNPNLFQKIFDEIKYMVKIATAGSKEARDLEKVKRAFEKAYRETSKTQEGTQYDIEEMGAIENLNNIEGYEVQEDNYPYDEVLGHAFTVKTKEGEANLDIRETKDKVYLNVISTRLGNNQAEKGAGTKILNNLKEYCDKTGKQLVIAGEVDSASGFYDRFDWLVKEKGEIVDDNGNTFDISSNNRVYNPQTKYSLTDNQGRELSEQQQEFFKDSKVRDDDGNLMVMYHGTKDEFTVFEHQGNKYDSGFAGKGFYFVSNKQIGQDYAEWKKGYDTPVVMETYLNMKKPLQLGEVKSGLKSAISQNLAVDINTNNVMSITPEESKKITDKLIEKGYDGVLYEFNGDTYAVVLNSNQIKNIDNSKPTSNPDIRYSLSVQEANTTQDNEGRKLTDNQLAYFKDSKAVDEDGNLVTVYHTTTDEVAQFNEFNPVGTPYYRFGDQVVNYFSDSKDMSGSYASQDYKMADTKKLNSIDEARQWLSSINEDLTLENNNIYWDNNEPEIKYDNEEQLLRNLKSDIQRLVGEESKLQYQGYVNITNPYIVDAEKRNWNQVVQQSNDFIDELDERVPEDVKNNLTRLYNESANKSNDARDNYEKYQRIMNDISNEYLTPNIDEDLRKMNHVIRRMGIDDVIKLTDLSDPQLGVSGWYSLADVLKQEGVIGDATSSFIVNEFKIPENVKYWLDRNLHAELEYKDVLNLRELYTKNQEAYKEFEKYRMPNYYFMEQIQAEGNDYLGADLEDMLETRAETMGADVVGEEIAQAASVGFSKPELIRLWGTSKTTNDVVKEVIASNKDGTTNYDGIIFKNVYDYGGKAESTTQAHDVYVTFNSNQFKAVDNLNPTNDADIRYQLGNNEVAPTSGWNVRSEDVRLQSAFKDAIAPIQEQVQQLTDTITRLEDRIAPLNEQEADELYQETQRGFENEVAPIRENLTPEENQRMDMLELLERNGMLTDERRYEKEQLENKINPVYPTEEATPGQALSDIRDIDEVGKRNVKAYQYEHPEVKPYFQEEARGMLNDLNNSIKGERFINESQERGQGTSYDVLGVKRFTSPEIAELLDSKYGYTYDDIRKGLNAIIEDHGAENIAIAKRIELVLDDNLRNGYTDWQTGTEIPPNQEYLNMLAEQEWQNYFDDINSQYPLDVNQVQYALEQERQQEEQYKIEKSLEEMTADDINLEPFLSGLQGASERQAERQQLREELNQKREVKIPKQSDGRRAVNRGLGLLVNEFAVLDDYSKQTGNKDIKFKTDTYNNYQAIAQSNIETAQTDINGKAIGRSGSSIFEEAKKLGLENTFDEYLKQWANVDRAKQGKGVANYSAKESYKIVKEMEAKYPALKRLGNDMWQYYRNARHNLRDAGVINQDVSDMLGRMYPHYTPYISENIENYFTDEGKLKPKATIKRAKGGAAIGSLLSAEEAMQRYTKSEFNTIFGNDLYREIVNTSNDIVQLGGDDRGMQFVNADNLYADKDGYYLTAYENGEPITARISEDMYRTLTRESRNRISDIENTFSVVTKPLQGLSKLRRNILTSWSPTFIAKNFIKDFQEGIFNSKYTKDFIKNYPTAFKELATNTELAQQFKSLYGSGLTMGQYDIDANNYNPSGKNRNFLKGIKNANELIELAPRFAEFKASIDHGASLQEAMYNAREVTTNFSRGGTLAKALNRNGFTFLNSSIQGFDKFIRNFSGENGAKGIVNSLAKAAIFGIAPAVFNELAFGTGDDKDEEYEALPDYIKDNYYIIKTGDGNFIRIPKGRVLSVFGSAARRTIEAMEGEKNAFEGYWNNVQQQIGINNPEENNIFAPLIQAMGGRKLDSGQTAGSAWYGGDIIPSRLQKERPEDQYDASIDKFSIWLGQRTGISPYKINYVLDQYTGGIGDIGLPMITPEANSDGSIIAPIKDQFTADTITDNKYVSEFYDTKGKLYTGSKATDEDVLKNKYMNSISSEMAKLYAERRDIQADDNLTKQQKYAKSQAIKAEINRLAKEGMDNYNDIIMSNNYAKIGDTEYYKNANGQWTKTTDDVASLGLDTEEKSEYYKVKNDIYTTKKNNDGNDKPLVVQDIINSNLTPDAKVNLYTSNYKDELIQPLVDSGMDVDSYLTFKSQNFTADKDSNGKSISGSKKRKVFDYINSMNVPYEQKLILAKSEYNSYNDNNYEIIEYIENSGMDYDERIQLYKSLGFKVDGDSISW